MSDALSRSEFVGSARSNWKLTCKGAHGEDAGLVEVGCRETASTLVSGMLSWTIARRIGVVGLMQQGAQPERMWEGRRNFGCDDGKRSCDHGTSMIK